MQQKRDAAVHFSHVDLTFHIWLFLPFKNTLCDQMHTEWNALFMKSADNEHEKPSCVESQFAAECAVQLCMLGLQKASTT